MEEAMLLMMPKARELRWRSAEREKMKQPWGDTDELLMCVKWTERDPNNEHTQPHTESVSWCIAHFVVIFNHIIQRYVFIVLFLLLADLVEILFIVCFSLLSSLFSCLESNDECDDIVAAVRRRRCSAQCSSINGNFRCRALEWCVLGWGRVRARLHGYMHQNKAKFTDIVLASTPEQNCKRIQTNKRTNSAHDREYIILHYDVNNNNNANTQKEKQIKRTRRAASKEEKKHRNSKCIINAVVLGARTQQPNWFDDYCCWLRKLKCWWCERANKKRAKHFFNVIQVKTMKRE